MRKTFGLSTGLRIDPPESFAMPRPRPPRPNAARGSGPIRSERPDQGRDGDGSGGRAAGAEAQWIWGLHPVRAALANPKRRIKRLIATSQGLAEIAALVKAKGVEPETVEVGRILHVTPAGSVHQGVAALLQPMAAMDIEDAIAGAPSPRRVVVLDQVSDPHNIGAILRSAAAFGVAAVVVQDRHTPQLSGVVAKAASGAAEIVPLVRVTNISRALEELEEIGFLRVGLADEATGALSEVDRARDVAIVLGAEGDGMRRLTREKCDLLVSLPTKQGMPSLNVSNAAAVTLFALQS
jgi:23S rRNA (guanosine2251-2'-O)-methyltransferase